jgi:8-oxo-dGTP pyrophosphatase MutT (NUDIX family)
MIVFANWLSQQKPTRGRVMSAIQFAQKAVVTDDGKILLVRKSDDDPNNPGLWELPGGRLKDGDDVNTHMIREVLEETGLSVWPGAPIDLWSWHMCWHGEQVQVVAVSRYCELNRAVGPAATACEVDDYLAEHRWFDLADVPTHDIIPSQLPTIELVVKMSV